jgi:spermidine synthase
MAEADPMNGGIAQQRMKGAICSAVFMLAWSAAAQTDRQVVFERVSAYHHIQVYDEEGLRTLAFNGSSESRMSLTDPLAGHFEYIEYFQMPFVWNPNIKRALMAGLGGGSAQRAYQHYFTNVMVDTVEIDPAVVQVAREYFNVTETPTLRIHTEDARQFLRRATNLYDVILMDAYATTRYGSSLPPHLTTREFFDIANGRLSANGTLAYNVIGQMSGSGDKLVAALYRTMKEVFPQVYLFPALETHNVVFIATKSHERFTWARLQEEGKERIRAGVVTLPAFSMRLKQFEDQPPANVAQSIILTDDYAPIESLMEALK